MKKDQARKAAMEKEKDTDKGKETDIDKEKEKGDGHGGEDDADSSGVLSLAERIKTKRRNVQTSHQTQISSFAETEEQKAEREALV